MDNTPIELFILYTPLLLFAFFVGFKIYGIIGGVVLCLAVALALDRLNS